MSLSLSLPVCLSASLCVFKLIICWIIVVGLLEHLELAEGRVGEEKKSGRGEEEKRRRRKKESGFQLEVS